MDHKFGPNLIIGMLIWNGIFLGLSHSGWSSRMKLATRALKSHQKVIFTYYNCGQNGRLIGMWNSIWSIINPKLPNKNTVNQKVVHYHLSESARFIRNLVTQSTPSRVTGRTCFAGKLGKFPTILTIAQIANMVASGTTFSNPCPMHTSPVLDVWNHSNIFTVPRTPKFCKM